MGNSYSIVMYGVKCCKMNCSYCSAVSTVNGKIVKQEHQKKEKKTDFKYDWNKLEDVLLHGKNTNPNDNEYSFDIWGMEPLENPEAFKQTVNFLEEFGKKNNKHVKIHTSSNGMSLTKKVADYLIEHNIGCQLSHDGCGQFYRSGNYDPLVTNKEHIVRLIKVGLLDWINCTLNGKNYSFYENINFWNKFRKDNLIMDIPITIKLNHIYPGTPPVTVFQNNKWETVSLDITGEGLRDYFHEFRELAILFRDENIAKSPLYSPYTSYILEQSKRWKFIAENENSGSCRAFQMGKRDFNFAVDTLGEYCQCNLLDHDHTVKHPSGEQPEYCQNCKYKDQSECHPCGSEGFPEKCDFRYAWLQVLEEFYNLDRLIEKSKKDVETELSTRLVNNLLGLNNNCNGNHNHSCKCNPR